MNSMLFASRLALLSKKCKTSNTNYETWHCTVHLTRSYYSTKKSGTRSLHIFKPFVSRQPEHETIASSVCGTCVRREMRKQEKGRQYTMLFPGRNGNCNGIPCAVHLCIKNNESRIRGRVHDLHVFFLVGAVGLVVLLPLLQIFEKLDATAACACLHKCN